ncbi:recombinase family protein [Streptomyces sp. NPDC051219]|uniref:recombinase family protein n=1 Tax=Streptomyces sp. NPDC051219 TaxID=3155283 RepID=UPI0034308B4B
MKRLGRDAAELTALADHLTAHGLVLEMLAGTLPGMYDPSGPGRLLFAFFAAMAETERDNIRESTLEGHDTAARKGKHGGRPRSSPTTCCTPCSGEPGCWPTPLAGPEDFDDLEGVDAHSRHASVRSLERYARPGVDAVAQHVAERAPAARRRR